MSTSRSLPKTFVRGVSFVTYSAAALLTGAALAQHKDVPFQGGIPVAPTGLANKPLGAMAPSNTRPAKAKTFASSS